MHRLRVAGGAQGLDQGVAPVATGGQLDLDQLVGPQGGVQLGRDGFRQTALTDADNGFAAMGTRTKKESLIAGEHGSPADDGETGASLARVHREALAAIKRELAAIVVFGALYGWAVVHWFDGLEEAVLLAGYGVGAALWIRVRAGGLLLSLRRGRGRDDGPQQ